MAELDRLLEDDQIFHSIKADLSQRRPHTLQTGRPSTPVEVILRLLIVKHLYRWSVRWVTCNWIPFEERRGQRKITPESTAYLDAKPEGDRSMPSKRKGTEGA